MTTAHSTHFRRSLAHDLRGISQLTIDATLGITQLTEHMTANILKTPLPFGEAVHAPTRGIFGLVYRSILGITQVVGSSLDILLRSLAPVLPTRSDGHQREMALAILNGVLGHHLSATHNPLATPMSLRYQGQALPETAEALASAVPKAGNKLLICVHGLCMNDFQWTRDGHDHGIALAQAGYTPLYLRYNTGEHISSNGRAFAAQLEALVASWPVPVESIVLLCHSMGGLVSRSACHYGQQAGHGWLPKLKKMIFLGTPHHGSPLERGGNLIDRVLGKSPYTVAFSRLGKIRSAGITDLRHGSICDEDWAGTDRFVHRRAPSSVLPLPAEVSCYAIGATLAAKQRGVLNERLGDGLVPLYSALGHHHDPARQLKIPKAHQWVAHGTSHFNLLACREVHARLDQWLAQP